MTRPAKGGETGGGGYDGRSEAPLRGHKDGRLKARTTSAGVARRPLRLTRGAGLLILAVLALTFVPAIAFGDKPGDAAHGALAGDQPRGGSKAGGAKAHGNGNAGAKARGNGKAGGNARGSGNAGAKARGGPAGAPNAGAGSVRKALRRGSGPAPAAAPPAAGQPVLGTRASSGRGTATARAAARREAAARRRRVAVQRSAARRERLASSRRRAALAAGTAAAADVAAAATAPVGRAGVPARDTRGPSPSSAEAGGPSIVTRTVESIREVMPGWAWALIAALAAAAVTAFLFAGSAAARERRAQRQRARLVDQVGLLQSALLPDVPARVGGLAASVAYRPAAGLAAGGDFYDVFAVDDDRVGIIVGDVAGHGQEAIGAATFVRHMVRSYLEAGLVPRAALQLAGQVLDEQHREDFATVVAAVHDRRAGTLSYATAGHPPPIVLGAGDHTPITVASAPPLGVGAPTGVRQTTMPLPAGSTVCFYTDGMIESRANGRQLGVDALRRALEDLGPHARASDLVAHVRRVADTVADDLAAVVVHAREGAASSLVRVEEIEVRLHELHGARLERFLRACGVPRAEIAGAIKTAAPRVVTYGSVGLRVRLAQERSGVDVLPVESGSPVSELAALRRS